MKPINEWTRKNVFVVLVTSLFLMSWLIFIATPFDIIASNIDEYTTVAGKDILLFGLKFVGISMVVVVVACLLILTLPRIIQKFIVFLIAAVAVTTWVVSTILVGNYGEFDGRNNLVIDVWSLNSILQWAVFFGIFLVFIQRRQIATMRYILVGLILTTLATSSISIYNKLSDDNYSDILQENDEYAVNNFFTYSQNNVNVVMILLDEYQTQFFEAILDDSLKDSLAGFTWFRDNAANYPTTIAAIPTILTGEATDNSQPMKEFILSNQEKSLPFILSNQGVNVNYNFVVSMGRDLFPRSGYINITSSFFEKNIDLINYTLFRSTPDSFKSFIFRDEKWIFMVDSEIQPEAKRLNFVVDHLINIKKNHPPTFKFFHSLITHSPITTDHTCKLIDPIEPKRYTLHHKAEEGKCAISSIVKFINVLKENNVYDNTMIVIVADHGNESNITVNGDYKHLPFGSASSTLLIKPINAKNTFEINDYPSQLQDLYTTILQTYPNSNLKIEGINLVDVIDKKLTSDASRIRYFNNYAWTKEYSQWKQLYLPMFTRYKIEGSLNDFDKWSVDDVQVDPVTCNALYLFNNKENKRFLGTGGLSGFEGFGRWIDGTKADVFLEPEKVCVPVSIRMKVTSFIPSHTVKQSAKVLINGVQVGNIISTSETKEQDLTFNLPKNMDFSKLRITFLAENPLMPKDFFNNTNDSRKLSFGLISIQLTDEVNR